jgi:hypothetical protein
MADLNVASSPLNASPHVAHPASDNIPAARDFASLTLSERLHVHHLTTEIVHIWAILSVASPFPARYHPDPDPNYWGIPLLRAILRMAHMTEFQCDVETAVGWVCESVEAANPDMWNDLGRGWELMNGV